MMGRDKPKRWTVQMLKDAVEVNLESHQFRLLSLEARQQLLERLLVEVLDSSSEDKDEIVH
jgi:hypothetical protein|tara:strand:+ start:1038 stop:1220 length:183 start_codon:yes stop_codon:yes gene_type:complete